MAKKAVEAVVTVRTYRKRDNKLMVEKQLPAKITAKRVTTAYITFDKETGRETRRDSWRSMYRHQVVLASLPEGSR